MGQREAEGRGQQHRGSLGGNLPGGVVGLPVRRRLDQEGRGGSELAAGGEALDQAGDQDDHRSPHTDLGVGWGQRHDQGAEHHQHQGQRQRVLPALAVGIAAQHHAAQRADQVRDREGRKGEDQRKRAIGLGIEVLGDDHGEGRVDDDVEPFQGGADGAADHRLLGSGQLLRGGGYCRQPCCSPWVWVWNWGMPSEGLGAQLGQEVVDERLAGGDLLKFDELVRGVGLGDVAGAAHDGGDAGVEEQAGLGAVGGLVGAGDATQLGGQRNDARVFGRIQARGLGQHGELDANLSVLLPHGLLDAHGFCPESLNEVSRVIGGNRTELEVQGALGRDGVDGNAAVDLVHRGGGVGDDEGLIERAVLPESPAPSSQRRG